MCDTNNESRKDLKKENISNCHEENDESVADMSSFVECEIKEELVDKGQNEGFSGIDENDDEDILVPQVVLEETDCHSPLSRHLIDPLINIGEGGSENKPVKAKRQAFYLEFKLKVK